MTHERRGRLLIIDDDRGTALIQQHFLQRAGYEAITAQTPEEALRYIDAGSIQLVLLDHQLEGPITGLEFYQQLCDSGRSLPTVLVTGFGDETLAIDALRAGIRDFVTKSADYLPTLGRSVEQVLRRAAAERRLAESEARFSAIFQASPQAIAVCDLSDGRLLEVNQRFLDLSGLARDEVIGRTAEELGIWPDPADSETISRRLETERRIRDLTLPLQTRSGETRWIQSSFERITLEGRECVLAFISDISERVQAEESLCRAEEQMRQAQKLEAIGRVAGGVAHDFNNLLTIVQGNLDLAMASVSAADPIHERLAEIADAAQQATTLTTQLLAFSRRQRIEPIVLDVNALVLGIRRLLHRIVGDQIDLVTVLTTEPAHVRADRGQIEQVLLNLAVNARDAMPRGGRLTVETALVSRSDQSLPDALSLPAGHCVAITVTDTGCGMTDEVRARLFEPFFTTKEPGKGSGLGLATVFGIVSQSGGRITVESAPGRGATFGVFLPEAGGTPSPQPEPEATDEVRGTETILLVEDAEFVRGLARRILEQHGYTALAASCGADALAVSHHHPGRIDLLLTDVDMPGMDGLHVAEQVRLQRPETKVLFVSGCADGALLRGDPGSSGADFLQKPYSAETLTRKIRQVLDEDRQSSVI